MLSFFPRGVLDEVLNLIESVSEGFPSYSHEGSFPIIRNQASALSDQVSSATVLSRPYPVARVEVLNFDAYLHMVLLTDFRFVLIVDPHI